MRRATGWKRLALAALILIPAGASAVRSQADPQADAPPVRVLVAPPAAGAAGADAATAALAAAMPALIAEAISADGSYTASLACDLAPDALQSLGLAKDASPDAAVLSAATAAGPLSEDADVRILILPSIERIGSAAGGSSQLKLSIEWRDLVSGKKGSASETASQAAGLVDAAGKGADAARRGWAAEWKSAGPAKPAPAAPARTLSQITSKSPAALSAWAGARAAWHGGDVPKAEAALSEALAADAGFDRARVDLAWIRLGQERNDEAASLAEAALKGTALSESSRGWAAVTEAAGRKDAAALEALGKKLMHDAPSSPWGDLAMGWELNLKGEHDAAIAHLDAIRLHRSNDPSVLHQAGIAGLGASDPFEALTHLERAAALWPQHDQIVLDLAEARVRNHDLDGAKLTLQAWRERFKPTDPPTRGGEWSIEHPPPPVLALGVDLLAGALSKSIDKLERDAALLEAGKAPVATRVAVLHALHEMQTELAFGPELEKQKWLNAARESLRALGDLIPPEEQQRRPWVLLRLQALIRVQEDRLPEARQIREKIMESSALPGYDPAIEAEVEAAIALKQADTDKHLEACRRAVKLRGELPDLYRLGQGLSLAARWKEVIEPVRAIRERIETWNITRPRDALLASPKMSLLVPFAYSLGGEIGHWTGDLQMAREMWGIFLAYFRDSDEAFKPFYDEAINTGNTAAW
jgi:tetratricopeptide repeat protein